MRALAALLFLLASIGGAGAQAGGYYPWTLLYPNIGYDFGTLMLPSTVAGGSKGRGAANIETLYIQGVLAMGGQYGAGLAPPQVGGRGGVFLYSAPSHYFLTGVDGTGHFTAAQPTASEGQSKKRS